MSDDIETTSADIDQLIERWHAETFPGSPVAHDTAIWNFISKAKDDLKARVAAALTPKTA